MIQRCTVTVELVDLVNGCERAQTAQASRECLPTVYAVASAAECALVGALQKWQRRRAQRNLEAVVAHLGLFLLVFLSGCQTAAPPLPPLPPPLLKSQIAEPAVPLLASRIQTQSNGRLAFIFQLPASAYLLQERRSTWPGWQTIAQMANSKAQSELLVTRGDDIASEFRLIPLP